MDRVFWGDRQVQNILFKDKKVSRLYQGRDLLYQAKRPWLPSDITGLEFWFDAGRPDLITSSNSIISQIKSRHNDAITATPNTGTAYYRPAGYDFYAPYFEFLGASMFTGVTGTNDYKCFISVLSTAKETGYYKVCGYIPHVGNNRFYCGTEVMSSNCVFYNGFGNLADQKQSVPFTPHASGGFYHFIYNHRGPRTVTIYSDGQTLYEYDAAPPIGRAAEFMLGYGSSSYAKTKEFLYYSKALSDDERQKLEGYIAHRYGEQAYLPTDHPYKKHPPLTDI